MSVPSASSTVDPAASAPRLAHPLRRHPLRIAAAALVLLVWGWWLTEAVQWEDRLVFSDTFAETDPIRSFMDVAEGIPHPGVSLAVPGGTGVRRVYRIARSPAQELELRLRGAAHPSIRISVVVDGCTIARDLQPGGPHLDLTGTTTAGLNAVVEIVIRNIAPSGSSPVIALSQIDFIRTSERPAVHWGALIYYATAGIFFWLFVVCVAIPHMFSRIVADRAALIEPRDRLLFVGGILAIVLAFGWLWLQPEWRIKKDYDDRAAVSNAAMLLESGFDQSLVYFRSRVRPGFLSIVQPLLALAPHTLVSYWINPSDNFRQLWWIYDQNDPSIGLFAYPLLSWMAVGLALLMIGAVYGLYRDLKAGLLFAGVATLLAVIFYGRSLTIAITQTVNLFVNVLVVWYFIRAVWPEPDDVGGGGGVSDGFTSNLGAKLLGGLFLGFACLIKETALTSIVAIGLFILLDGPARQTMRRVVRSLPFWLAALVFPCWYFGLVAEGGFGEITANFGSHLEQGELNPFEPLTFGTGMRDLAIVFSWIGLALAAAGIVVRLMRRPVARADRLFLAWTIGCLPVFTLPYIFPRFLKYFIPAMSWWVTAALFAVVAAVTARKGDSGRKR